MSMGWLIVTALVALTVADAAVFLVLMGALMTRAIAEMTRTKWGDVAGAFFVAFVAMVLAWAVLESGGCQGIPYSMGGTEGWIEFQYSGNGTYEPKLTIEGRCAND